MARTTTCTAATRQGRLNKANEFSDAAEVVAESAADANDVANAHVTLLVHAGIAAADVVCCAHLGVHALGENHNDAVALLAKIDRKLADDLRTLLAVKTKSGYSHQPTTKTDRIRAQRATTRLLQAARDLPAR